MKHQHTTPLVFILLASLACAAGACRKKKNEQSQGLNFDAIFFSNVNNRGLALCGDGAAVTDTPEVAKDKAYKAVPEKLRQLFPSQEENIRLHSIEDVMKICRSAIERNPAYNQLGQNEASKQQMQMLLACATVEQKSPDKPDLIPVIHLQNDAKIIYANMIRTMAWAFSELMDRAAEAAKKNAGSGLRSAALVEDMAKANDFFNALVGYRRSLLEAVFIDLGNRFGDGIKKRYLTLYNITGESDQEKNKLYDVTLLQHFMLSEVVDSYYCSKDSLAQIRNVFSAATLCAFAPFAEYFGRKPYHQAEGDTLDLCPPTPALTATATADSTPTPAP